MTPPFSIREVLWFGWGKVRERSGLVFQAMLALFVLQVLSAFFDYALEGVAEILAGFFTVLAGVVVGTGFTFIVLRLAQGFSASIRDIIPPLALVWRFFWAGLFAGLIAALPLLVSLFFAGFIGATTLGWTLALPEPAVLGAMEVGAFLLVVVAVAAGVAGTVYFSLRFSMVRFAVVDGAAIVESLHRSTTLTRGVKGKLLLFLAAALLLNFLGALVFLVGLLVTIPVTMIAHARVYEILKTH